jgi:hypothetical protein
MILPHTSSSSSAVSSSVDKLPVEILQQITEHLKAASPSLEPLLNLYDAHPSAFHFLKCFKDIHDAGIAENYPFIYLKECSPEMTPDLLDALVQSEPKIVFVYHPKHLHIVMSVQFRQKTKVKVDLYNHSLAGNTHAVHQIILGLESTNDNFTYIRLYNNNLIVDDFIVLAKALEHRNNRLATLFYASNECGYKGAEALANALVHPHCKLLELKLDVDDIGLEGIALLKNAVVEVRKKREIDIIFMRLMK